MLIREESYLEFLEQRQFIIDLSAEADDNVDKLFFQDMVIENLTPAEKERYIQLLLEPRPRYTSDIRNEDDEMDSPKAPKKSFFSRIKDFTTHIF